MIALMWNASVAIRRYLRTFMPSNIAIDQLRTQRGLSWVLPVALAAGLAYLVAAAAVSSVVERGGPGSLNVLILLFIWNAMKFVWMGVLSLPVMARVVARERRVEGYNDHEARPPQGALVIHPSTGTSSKSRPIIRS